MLMNEVARQYAQAIYDLAGEQQKVDEVQAQLEYIGQTVSEQTELANLLYHPRVPAQAKKDTLKHVFGQEVSPLVRNSLFLLIDKHREMALSAVIQEFMQIVVEARNIAEAEVTTAMPLSETQRDALSAKLSAVTGKQIVLKVREDKAIIGGVVVKIGGKVIDGSVLRQLNTLQAALLRAEMTEIGVTN